MAAPHEAATFKYSKGTFGCFVVPKKKDKMKYGYLHHNIGFTNEDDCGTFVMEDGTMETYGMRIVDAATLRLLKGDPIYCPCHPGFVAAKVRLQEVDLKLRSDHPDDWQQIRAAMQAESLRKYRVNNPVKIAKLPKQVKAKPPVFAYAKKTPVAGRCGTSAPFTVLEPWTACGWWAGTIMRVETKNLLQPYVIKFYTKPKPVQVRVSEPVVKALVRNYQWCEQHCIFQGIVGQELLWPTLSPNSQTVILRFTKVLELNRLTQLYKLSFRDAETFELSGPLLDRATTQEEHIRSGVEVSLEVVQGVPGLAKFSPAQIQSARSEQGRYKMTGPAMMKGTNRTGTKEGHSSEESDSDEDGDSSEEGSASTVSSNEKVVPKIKPTKSLGGTRIKGTQDDVTLIGGGKDRNGAKASQGASKGNRCTCTCTL